MNNRPYYYGQGKISIASLHEENKRWYWIGDASHFSLDISFEDKQKKTSIGGRLVNSQRYIFAIAGAVSITWNEISHDNLKLLFNATALTNKQGWQRETFRNITAGSVVALEYHNVRKVDVEGMREGVHYIANLQFGSVEFLTTPPSQPVFISYDFSQENSLELLNSSFSEFSLRYDGINLLDNNSSINIELYRLSLDPAIMFELINSSNEAQGIETTAQLLPDMSKFANSSMGLFGRFITGFEFKSLTYNNAINYDGTYEHVY